MNTSENEMTQRIESAIRENNEAVEICIKPLLDELNRRQKELVEKEVKIQRLRRENDALGALNEDLKERNRAVESSLRYYKDARNSIWDVVDKIKEALQVDNIQYIKGYVDQCLREIEGHLEP